MFRNTTLINEIIEFTKELVAIPSYDSEREIASKVLNKLDELGLPGEVVGGDLEHPSVVCFVNKVKSRKTIWLQAPLDTTPPGNIMEWDFNPLQAKTEENKMMGLGVADAKIAIAIFCYLAHSLKNSPAFEGSIFLGFDALEQSGKFVGIREIIPYAPRVDACLLGYQSFDEIHIGARGWLRLKLTVNGQSAHTGAARKRGINAIHYMNKALSALLELDITKTEPYFEYGSNISVSKIDGGEAINIIPNRCDAYIDIRLTPSQKPLEILANIQNCLTTLYQTDDKFKYNLEVLQAENGYLTNPEDPLVKTLQRIVFEVTQKLIPLVSSGPGSVGNILSQLGFPIINAYGVRSKGVHSNEEWIDVSTIEPVFEVWKRTLIEFSQN